jgi:hypothetical protein
MSETIQDAPPKKESPIPINPLNLWHQRGIYEERVRAAERALAIETEARETHVRSEHERLRTAIMKKARTSGDPLTDEAICCYGVDQPKVESLIALNQRFLENAGKECLILVPWIMASGNISTLGGVLGTLTGSRMQILMEDKLPEIHFPFHSFVADYLPFHIDPRRQNGTMKLGVGQSAFSLSKFHDFLDNFNNRTAGAVLIGGEIDEAIKSARRIAGVSFRKDQLDRLRSILAS